MRSDVIESALIWAGVVVLALICCFGALQCQRQECATDEKMAKAGYEQRMVVGRTSPIWVRACPCPADSTSTDSSDDN